VQNKKGENSMPLARHISCFCLSLFIFSCSGIVTPFDDADILNCSGTIVYVSDLKDQATYYIQSDVIYQGAGDLFYPNNLPVSFKIDGLRVIFTAELIECPPNAVCLVQEIKLLTIKAKN
jgi:hypothetical protein